jgi:hypothetical protein
MAVMAQVVELAVIGPIPTDGSLKGKFVLEHQIPLLDSAGEALDLFCYAGADHYLPVHGHTIQKSRLAYKGNGGGSRDRVGRGFQVA